jgi:hypothetical protein
MTKFMSLHEIEEEPLCMKTSKLNSGDSSIRWMPEAITFYVSSVLCRVPDMQDFYGVVFHAVGDDVWQPSV